MTQFSPIAAPNFVPQIAQTEHLNPPHVRSLAFTVNMYQSSTRNNFLDTLLDPMAIAILASIALHATIGASLPFFTQPEKEGKKVGPSTVKVVELTPSELQRIPQAPPAPKPQVLPPVAQPVPSARPAVTPPRTPQFSTAPQTIPFSPIRAPFDGVTIKPPQGNKQQKATPQKQPIAPIFDPEEIFKPTPKPSKSPLPKGSTPKPSQPTPTPTTSPATKKTTTVTPTPQPSSATDDDGSDSASTPTPSSNSTKPTQQPSTTPQPSSPSKSSLTPATSQPRSQGNDTTMQRAANAKLIEYRDKYPDLKVYLTKNIVQNYSSSALKRACPKTPQAPVVVYMVAFDKVPDNQNANILGNITSDILDSSTFPSVNTPENQVLIAIAKDAAISAATTADRNRPPEDKGKQVLHQYRVQLNCNP